MFIGLIILLIIVSLVFTVATMMLLNVEENIVGVWSSSHYFTEYGGKLISETLYSAMEFDSDGTYAIIRGNSSNSILEYEEGTWTVSSGFRIIVDIKNEIDDTVYYYNPLTDEMKSGVWVYQRAE